MDRRVLVLVGLVGLLAGTFGADVDYESPESVGLMGPQGPADAAVDFDEVVTSKQADKKETIVASDSTAAMVENVATDSDQPVQITSEGSEDIAASAPTDASMSFDNASPAFTPSATKPGPAVDVSDSQDTHYKQKAPAKAPDQPPVVQPPAQNAVAKAGQETPDTVKGLWREYMAKKANAQKAEAVAKRAAQNGDNQQDAMKDEELAEAAAGDASNAEDAYDTAEEKVFPSEGADLQEPKESSVLTEEQLTQLWRSVQEEQANARKAKFVAKSAEGTADAEAAEQAAISAVQKADELYKKYKAERDLAEHVNVSASGADASSAGQVAASAAAVVLSVAAMLL